nr:ATP-binding cassette domain-containing protein [Pseudobdellovibrionaceae bacterium]
IEAIGLGKTFEKQSHPAVHSLNLSIRPGESVAFLGPNGAGKSTTIKMLCGILQPDQGQSKILGYVSGAKEANLKLGLVFGARSQLYFHMTVLDSLRLQAETYFLSGPNQQKRIDFLAEVFECQDLLGKRVRELSLGQRMRCEIVASLVHKPQVILLDEPTIGLDVLAKYSLRKNLKEWQNVEKTTMLLTSHDLTDVEALCERAILINKGEKAYDGPLVNLKGDLVNLRRVKLRLSDGFNSQHPKFSGINEISSHSPLERDFEFSLDEIRLSQVMQFLSESYGDHLVDIQISGVTLEEVIQKKFASEGR